MSLTFTRRFLDADGQYLAFKQFIEFRSELCAWDMGTLVNNGRVLSSTDGTTWSTLFNVSGYCNADDGNGMAVYLKHLFISLYRPGTPHVIEYNPSGGIVTYHLPNPQAGGQDNNMAADMAVCFRKLWVVTDVTTFVNDRRVVYYYDGVSWTAITNYDGATYLDYNRADANSPAQIIKHRTTRLLVFNSELYLIASRYDSGLSKWAWEVWKFDAANFDRFNLVFDSIGFVDNCVLSAVLVDTLRNKVYVMGNEIESNGNPTNIARLYSSPDMLTWTEESAFPLFLDEFNDASRDIRWTDDPNNGTITESGGFLTLAVAGGVNGNWDVGQENAPVAIMNPGKTEITIEINITSYTVNDDTRAGIYITDAVGGGNGIIFGRYRNDSFGKNGLQVRSLTGGGELAYAAVTTMPIWLRVRVSGSGAGSVMKFDYSTNGVAWTTLHTQNNESWGLAGLIAMNWGVFNAIAAPFEYFRIYKSVGFPYGEKFFEGRIYLNCQDTLRNNTWIRYWDEVADEFALEQEITTNVNARGGGLESFSNGLYAGKYMEIYGAPGAVRDQARTRGQSLVVMEMDWKNKLDQVVTRRIAPLDTRAPTRFYEGRLVDLSSLPRSFNDMTGLFENSDLSATLSNADKEYSKLASSYSADGQEMRLYHLWANEPERFRQHIITMITENYGIKGIEFKVSFKDMTEKYFKIKVPTEICTEEDFSNIHPDHKGRFMPEILGLASLTTGENLGAVEAVYIDTSGPPFRYIASRGRLYSVDSVYVDNVIKFPGGGPDQYQVTLGTPTYIDMNSDRGDARITFNGKGYLYGAWNSAGGYVQNPAYVMAYFLRFIVGIPFSLLNMDAFDSLADLYTRLGAETSGKLILQYENDADEILRQLLFSFGAKGFVAKDGRLKAERKDISNYASDLYLFDQNDLLDSPDRDFGLDRGVNKINVVWDYIPYLKFFKSADSERMENYLDTDKEKAIEIPREDLPV